MAIHYWGQPSKLEALIQAGVDINQIIGPCGIALHYAVGKKGNALARLLAAGAHVDAIGGSNEETPLMTAINSGCIDHCRQLLNAGADPNKRDKSGRTALMLAIPPAEVEASPQPDDSPMADLIADLQRAASTQALRWLEIIRMLIEAGADANATDRYGYNALAHTRNPAVSKLLRDAGARDVKQPEQNLALASETGDLPTVNALIQAGVDPNMKTVWGATPLMVAAGKGHTEIVNALLHAGADPNMGAPGNWTPLMNAAYDGHLETVRALLAAGTDAGMVRDGDYSTLMYAQNAKRGPAYKPILDLIREALKNRPQNTQLPSKRGVEFSDLNVAVLLVKASLEDTLVVLAGLSPSATILRDVFEKQVEVGNHSFIVYQFKGHPWTTMMEVGGLMALDEQAKALAVELKTKALTYEYSDTACAYRYRLFDGQTLIESLESDDGGFRFSSTLRRATKRPPKDLQKFIDEFFKSQDAFVPGIGMVFMSESGKTFDVNLPGYNPSDFVRVDFVSL